MDAASLHPGQCGELLIGGTQARECLRSARRQYATGVGELAAATATFDQALARRGLQQAEVLADARLADPELARRARQAPASATVSSSAVGPDFLTVFSQPDATWGDVRCREWLEMAVLACTDRDLEFC